MQIRENRMDILVCSTKGTLYNMDIEDGTFEQLMSLPSDGFGSPVMVSLVV